MQARKKGERKIQVSGEVDLLSLFLKEKEIFTDDFIVDELVDFFIAASMSTQTAT